MHEQQNSSRNNTAVKTKRWRRRSSRNTRTVETVRQYINFITALTDDDSRNALQAEGVPFTMIRTVGNNKMASKL